MQYHGSVSQETRGIVPETFERLGVPGSQN